MALSDLPLWAQQLAAFLVTLGTAVALHLGERRKSKRVEAEPPRGEGVVLSATMADSSAIRELITCVRDLDRTQHEVVAELRRNTDETHDLTKNAIAIRAIMERFDAYRNSISQR